MVLRFERYPVAMPNFNSIFDFQNDVDDLFGNFLGTQFQARVREFPSLDLVEDENNTVVVAEMPGVKKEDVKVSVQNDLLTISGERKDASLPEGSGWIRNEIRTGKFNRTIALPHAINAKAISAELDNGVLKIVLPKADEARSLEIQVK